MSSRKKKEPKTRSLEDQTERFGWRPEDIRVYPLPDEQPEEIPPPKRR